MTTSEGFSSSVTNLSDDLRQIDLNGLADIDQKNLMDLDRVFKLEKSSRYIEIMQKVEENAVIGSCDEQLILNWKNLGSKAHEQLKRDCRNENVIIHSADERLMFHWENLGGEQLKRDWGNFLEKNERLILECYALSVEIENEIISIFNFMRVKFNVKFEEVDLLVDDKIEYARAIKRIGNNLVEDLIGVLPSTIIMVFCCWQIGQMKEACDRAIALVSAKKKLEDFVEGRMRIIAPNLCAYVGSGVAAAKIISTVGCLGSLVQMSESDYVTVGEIISGYFGLNGVVHPIDPSTPNTLPKINNLGYQTECVGNWDVFGFYPTGNFGARTRTRLHEHIDMYRNMYAKMQEHINVTA